MKRATIGAAAALGVVAYLAMGAPGRPAPKPAKLVFPGHGFSILPLEGPPKGTSVLLMMYLPANTVLAPNVNVVRQEFAGTIDDYIAASKKQFADSKMKLVSETKTGNAVTLEYTGSIEGNALHWYARAVLRPGAIYLATATVDEGHWKELSGQLIGCVDSLEFPATTAPARNGPPQ